MLARLARRTMPLIVAWGVLITRRELQFPLGGRLDQLCPTSWGILVELFLVGIFSRYQGLERKWVCESSAGRQRDSTARLTDFREAEEGISNRGEKMPDDDSIASGGHEESVLC